MKHSRGISARLTAVAVGAVCLLGAAAMPPAALAQPAAGTIEGTTTAAPGGAPVQVKVCAYLLGEATTSGCATSDASGEYAIEGLAAGSYEVEFSTAPGEPEFVKEFYVGKATREAAQPVVLTAAEGHVGIDARMVAVATATAKPEHWTSPGVWGEPEVGGTLGCDPGIWSQKPETYGYQWLRDDDPIESATEAEYEVTAADRGHLIGCEVTATSSFGSATAASGVVAVPQLQHSLTVSVTGSGVVSSEPGGIFCGLACVRSFDLDTDVVLIAEPDPGATFSGWTGACSGSGACMVELDSDLTVGASFAAVPSATAPSGGSTAVSGPAPSPTPKPLRCRKGFRKKGVRGKQRCVKVHKKKHHKHRHR